MKRDLLNIRLSPADRAKLNQISTETNLNYSELFRCYVLNHGATILEIRQHMLNLEKTMREITDALETIKARQE